MQNQEYFMQRCLDLAQKGVGLVSPNPMVGCVIVYEGEIIGEGFHQKYGEGHAEVNAIANVNDKSYKFIELEDALHVSI